MLWHPGASKMNSAVSKLSAFSAAFRRNLSREIEANRILRPRIEYAGNIVSSVLRRADSLRSHIPKPLSFIGNFYQPARTGTSEVLIHSANNGKDGLCTRTQRNQSILDTVMEKTFGIPQYYGGIRDAHILHRDRDGGKPTQVERLSRVLWLPKMIWKRLEGLFSRSRLYHDFAVLYKVENDLIPSILHELFRFDLSRGLATPEATESLKKLRRSIVDKARRNGMSSIELTLDDIRMTSTEKVYIKNLKKTIKATAEFVVKISGRRGSEIIRGKEHFGGVFEFIKNENSEWACNSFSFEQL